MKSLHQLVVVFLFQLAATGIAGGRDWIVFEGKEGPGKGRHIVLVSGDDEYRSEEALPMLARILAERHGFKCTVLFPIGPDGAIDPAVKNNIPGLSLLESADLCILFLRFRELPDAQMKPLVDYVNSGRSVIALRTSTHAFSYSSNSSSPYVRYDYRSKDWPGGFGQQVLGETWVNHHGAHGKESTRGIVNGEFKGHPILCGVSDLWGPSDVYTVTHIPEDAKVLVWGQVVAGMRPADPPLAGPKNDPMMPVVWLRDYRGAQGRVSKVLTTTMGAAVDLQCGGLRRLLVNACYFFLGLEASISSANNVEYVGDYSPSWFGFGTHRKGVRPADLELK